MARTWLAPSRLSGNLGLYVSGSLDFGSLGRVYPITLIPQLFLIQLVAILHVYGLDFQYKHT